MKNSIVLFFLAVFAISSQVFAHSDEYLDSIATPHGGQMRMAGMYHFELVVKENELNVYITDHADQPIASQNASGQATILAAGQRSHISLQTAGGNKLKGKGTFAMDEQMRVVLNIGFHSQQAEQARFTPLAPRSVEQTGHENNHADHSHH